MRPSSPFSRLVKTIRNTEPKSLELSPSASPEASQSSPRSQLRARILPADQMPAAAPSIAAASATRAGSPEDFDEDNLPSEPSTSAPSTQGRGLGIARAATSGQAIKGFGLGRAEPPPQKAKRAVIYSEEQLGIIHCDDPVIVVDAFAGCAKTTTAIAFAEARPNEKFLYLCLNAANAAEAKGRFGPNVDVMTTHALAWREMRSHVRDRLSRDWKPMLIMDQLQISSPRLAASVKAVLESFWHSMDREISEYHIESIREARRLQQPEVDAAVGLAKIAWRRMQDRGDSLQMPDDAYLKMFALKGVQVPHSHIILDEAQDTNPVTLQLIKSQHSAKLLAIGDRHQNIYGFRGSINAIEILGEGATRKHLSQTWRFGPQIASIANTVLSQLKKEGHRIQAMGADGSWNPRQVTRLARTNAHLFRIAAERRGRGVHWIGGPQNYRIDLVEDAYHLWSGNQTKIKNFNLKKHGSWTDFSRYADEAHDSEAAILVNAVEEYRSEIPELISDIRQHAVAHADGAEVILTTGHKSKGLEWNCVQIEDDFEVIEEAVSCLKDGTVPSNLQDINLLYVAITRARQSVSLNQETQDWLEHEQVPAESGQAQKLRA